MLVTNPVATTLHSYVPHLATVPAPSSTTTLLMDNFLVDGTIESTSTFVGIVGSTMSTIQDTLGTAIASAEQSINSALIMASIDPNKLWQLQQFGEKTFAAAFLISFVQAMLVWFEYGESPTGVLVIPPGLTHGVESPTTTSTTDTTVTVTANKQPRNEIEGVSIKARRKKRDKDPPLNMSGTNKKEENKSLRNIDDNKSSPCLAMIKTLNRYMALLIPWASNAFAFLLEGNSLFFHLGFLYSLAELNDFPNRLFSPSMKRYHQKQHDEEECNLFADNLDRGELSCASSDRNKVPERIVVLGDSLAVGIGSVNQFETDRPMGNRVENLAERDDEHQPGPVFPRVLANTLAKHGQRPVHWRSAGVDGGDTKSIHEQCLGVIQEEVDQGRPPDVVVLIVGVNDLKYFSSNPLRNAGPKEFRSRLVNLITEIQALSPTTKVVLPELRVFHQNSPLNVFPLTYFLDRVLGFWDFQKRLVANRYPDSEVQYLELSPREVKEWYMTDTSKYGVETELNEDGLPDMSLISADGVHPNARAYAHWAATIGDKLVSNPNGPAAFLPSTPAEARKPRKAFLAV